MDAFWLHLLILFVLVSIRQSEERCENVYLTTDKQELKIGDSIAINCTGCTEITLEIESEYHEVEFSEELCNETRMSSLLMKQWVYEAGELIIRCHSSQTVNYEEMRLLIHESNQRRRGVHNPKRRYVMKAMRILPFR